MAEFSGCFVDVMDLKLILIKVNILVTKKLFQFSRVRKNARYYGMHALFQNA